MIGQSRQYELVAEAPAGQFASIEYKMFLCCCSLAKQLLKQKKL
jgi:hypothetical protein